MPDHDARGPGGDGALPGDQKGTGHCQGPATTVATLMKGDLRWTTWPRMSTAAMHGWSPLVRLLEKRKYLSCPTMTENLQEKGGKYSLCSREANDHSLNNTGIFLSAQLQEKGRKEKQFLPWFRTYWWKFPSTCWWLNGSVNQVVLCRSPWAEGLVGNVSFSFLPIPPLLPAPSLFYAFINLCMYVFNKLFLSTYYVPRPVLGAEEVKMNKIEFLRGISESMR